MIPLMCMLFAPMADPNPDDGVLKHLFQMYLDEVFEAHPAFATAMGNHDHDDRLDDLRPATRALREKSLQLLIVDVAKKLKASNLSRAAQIDSEIWQHAVRFQIWQNEHDNRFENDPRVYGEYCTDSVYSLLTQSTLPRARNVANAAKRIAGIPRVIEAAKLSLKTPAKELTEIAITRTKGSIAFYEKGIYELAKETPTTSELRGPCQSAVKALKDFLVFLESDLLPRSTGTWRLGKAKFAEKLELELNAGLTADEVIREAEAEATRVEGEMYKVAVGLHANYFPNEPLPKDRNKVIAVVLAKIGEDRSTNETMIVDAKKSVESIKAFIREKRILALPEPDRCKIIEMPEFQRGFSAAYLNNAPPLDAKADSIYAISPPPSDWSKERQEAFYKEYNRRMLQILTIHEAYPGHYVQLEYSNRHPSMIRKIYSSGVYIEGWAVYTEQMMLDAGYGDGDPALRMQQLKFYMRAVLNAILDYKMHCESMSDEEALKLLMGRGFQTEAEAVGKVARAKQSSCQLSTYFVGRTAFNRLRLKVQSAQGAKFNLMKFHEAVLNEGSVPVKYLPELVK